MSAKHVHTHTHQYTNRMLTWRIREWDALGTNFSRKELDDCCTGTQKGSMIIRHPRKKIVETLEL